MSNGAEYGQIPPEDKDELRSQELALERASHAAVIMDDPMVKEAFAMMEERHLNTLRHGSTKYTVMLRARICLAMLSRFQVELQSVMGTGKVAVESRDERAELDELLNAAERDFY